MKTRLKREETAKKTRTKILHKVHGEALKDKHNLILDLQASNLGLMQRLQKIY